MPLQEPLGLTIRLFGGFSLSKASQSLPRTRTRSCQWLLALLALRSDRDVDRAWLAATLWPDSGESQALYNLRRCLSDLRSVLGEDAFRLVSPTFHTVLLDTSGALVDIVEFERAITQADTTALEKAIRLYAGPFLEGCQEEWALSARRQYEQSYLTALDTLAAQAIARQQYPTAIEILLKALACDPLRETAMQSLMLAMDKSGDTAGALAVYRQFRVRMHHDLQAEPDAETVSIYRNLRAGKGSTRPEPLSPPTSKPVLLHRLPHPLTPLIGRESQITQIVDSLRDGRRLVTLVGTGGIGKTRLAIAVAHQVAPQYAEGVWFVDLATLTDASQMAQTVAVVLGAPEEHEPSDALCRFLARKSLLLILDNCEHLLPASAELAQALLSRCPEVCILATSRQALGIYGEHSCRVPGLSLPSGGALSERAGLSEPGNWEEFLHSDAVRLFMGCALAANSAFRLTPENVPHVIRICCLLDGIPFALELAAAWVRSLPVTQIADRLDRCFEFLIRGDSTALPRQQTLRAVLDWSYHLLTEAEKTILRQLATFADGWTLEAAEAICVAEETGGGETKPEETLFSTRDVLLLLTHLVDKSLVVYDEQEGRARYRLLETTRQYARDQWQANETRAFSRRHAVYFLQWARRSQVSIEQFGTDSPWYAPLRDEQDNLHAALAWWRQENPEEGGILPLLLYRCGLLSYHSHEASAWIACLAAEAGQSYGPSAAALYCMVGEWANWLGNVAASIPLWHKSLNAATQREDKLGMAKALLNLGSCTMYGADPEQAEAYLQASQSYFEALGEDCQCAAARNQLAMVAFYRGDMATAQQYIALSLQAGRDLENVTMISDALDVSGFIAWKQQDYPAAKISYKELVCLLSEDSNRFTANALRHLGAVEGEQNDFASAWRHLHRAYAINQQVGFVPGKAWDRCYMARLAFQQGDQDAGWNYLAESLRLFEAIGEAGSVNFCLRQWAQFEGQARHWERAVCLWSHTERLMESYQSSIPAYLRAEFNAFLAACRSELNPAVFQAAWSKGQRLPVENAVEYAFSAHLRDGM